MASVVTAAGRSRGALAGARTARATADQQPVAEFSRAAAFRQTLGWQAFGLCLLVCHVLLVKTSVALFPVAVLVFIWIRMRTAFGALILFFQVLLYQNIVISCFSGSMDHDTFTVLQGTNFVFLAIIAAPALARLWPPRQAFTAPATALFIGLGVIAVYTVIGAAKAGPTSAIVYLREFSAPLMAAAVGIEVGRTWGFRTVATVFIYSAALSFLLSIVEYAWTAEYYTLVDAVGFNRQKYFSATDVAPMYTVKDVIKQYTFNMFNITGGETGGFQNFRVNGSVVNPISNGYVLAIIGLAAISLRRFIWLVPLIPLLVLIGVKGSMILLSCSVALWFAWMVTANMALVAVLGLVMSAAYVGSGIYWGLQNHDFHVIGFMGGLRSLLSDPIGHGIGVGGNMSAKASAGFHWKGRGGFQTMGADFALESAVGVMFYQIGVMSAAIVAVFVTILAKVPWRSLASPGFALIPFALAVVAVNGVFQEEAWAPYGGGLLMLFTCVLVANQGRASVDLGQLGRYRA